MVEKKPSSSERRWNKQLVAEVATKARAELLLRPEGTIFTKQRRNVFNGSDLVSFIVEKNYVQSSQEAVELGQLMMEDLHFAESGRNSRKFTDSTST
jgi:hypothetical protein